MLNKFFKFFKGYVIIEISGKNTEHFINNCLKNGIDLENLIYSNGSVRAYIKRSYFKMLLPLRRKHNVKIKIIKKKGIYSFFYRHKKRYPFLIGLILCIAFIITTSGYIWTVEINGIENSDINNLVTILHDNGLYIGAKKRKIPELYTIKNEIINNTDDIAWIWVYIEGTKARIEVVERRTPPQILSDDTPCDINAISDGVIKRIQLTSGAPLVKKGDAVLKGDTLISGKLKGFTTTDEEKYLYVHSIADIEAYTVHSAKIIEPLYYQIRTPLKNHKRYYTLEIFGKRYNLYKDKKIPFKDYDIKTKCYELKIPFLEYVGIGIRVEDNIEVSIKKQEITLDTALNIAKSKAEEKIAKEILPKSQLVDTEINYKKINEENIEVEYKMNFIENIGIQTNIKE